MTDSVKVLLIPQEENGSYKVGQNLLLLSLCVSLSLCPLSLYVVSHPLSQDLCLIELARAENLVLCKMHVKTLENDVSTAQWHTISPLSLSTMPATLTYTSHTFRGLLSYLSAYIA